MSPPALLALEDGTVFSGIAYGARAAVTGEVCFNTAMTGYQEVLTDPSYHRQIVTMTASQIGNTGTNSHDDQSPRPWVTGFVMRAASPDAASWRSQETLDDYLTRHGVPGIAEVDTRRLTRHIRTKGALRGALSTEETPADVLVDMARATESMVGLDLAGQVTTTSPYEWGVDQLHERASSGYAAGAEAPPATRTLIEMADEFRNSRIKVAALDFGLKRNILDLLVATGCDVTVLPANTSANEIVAGGFDAVFLSNGPGDPEPVQYAVATVKALLGRLPIFGICLGHQILGLAAGARTFKLLFGHRGGNHPVKRLDHDRVEITCQNHGFAVDPESIEHTAAHVTHVNLNDGTVEGLELPGLAFSVQYHPEAGPGPHDARYLFARFRSLVKEFSPVDDAAAAPEGKD